MQVCGQIYTRCVVRGAGTCETENESVKLQNEAPRGKAEGL